MEGRQPVLDVYSLAYGLAAVLAAPLLAPILALALAVRLLSTLTPPPLVPLAPGEYVQVRLERGPLKPAGDPPPDPPLPPLLQQLAAGGAAANPQQQERRPTVEARIERGSYTPAPAVRTFTFEIPAGPLDGVLTVVNAVGPGRLREAYISSADPTVRVDVLVDGRPALPIHADLRQLAEQTRYTTYASVFEEPGAGWRIHIGELNFTRSLLLRLYGRSGRVSGTAVVDALAVVG